MIQNKIIPDGWIMKPLSEVAPLQRGFDLPNSQIKKGPYPIVYSNGILNHHAKWMCKAPGLITGRSGTIGKFTYIEEGFYWPHNTSLWVTSFKDNIPLFVKYLFETVSFESYSTGTGVPTLNRNDLHTCPLILPKDKEEQQNIASALSSIDKLIDDLGRTIQKKQLIREGAMEKLLSGKKRLPGFTEEWVEKNLGEVCQIIMGQSPDSRYYNTSKQGFPLIQGNADIENRKSIDRIYTTQITKICDVGDVIMSVRAPVGAVGISSKKSCIGRGICAMKGCNSFVYQWLIFQESKWAFLSTGSTFDSINSDALNKVRLLTPIDENEQHAIANILTSMDDEISVLQIEKAKYEQIRSGMMEELLTGKKRLK